MGFDTAAGTRGARQPRSGIVQRWVNQMAVGRIRRTGKMAGLNSDQVKIELNGGTIPVTAEQLHGAERDEAWRQITAAAPRFAQYQRKTDRELPIIRLISQSG
jgi:hypothetical protein